METLMRKDREPSAWVLLVRTANGGAAREDFPVVEACCRFHGLRAISHPPDEPLETDAWPESPVAVVIGADVFSTSAGPVWVTHLEETLRGVPILLLGVDQNTDESSLQRITSGRLRAGVPTDVTLPAVVRIGADRALAGPLAGQSIPAPAASFSALEQSATFDSEPVAVLAGADGNATAPCWVRLTLPRGETWVAAAATGRSEGWYFEREHFGRRPPALVLAAVFLCAAVGERCWRTPATFANLCIDDPRLTEPYGRMSFAALLAEAQRNNFHATVGFIPWNYDRNVPRVVDLVARHSRWLSIAVHGNNHDRYEFYGPQRWREGDPWRVKTLAEQETNLRQAVARMEEFTRASGLPHDRVMVFPHAIGSAGTLRLLKNLGFLGTANYNNFPLGTPAPADLAECLGTVNCAACGFPALRRDYPRNRAEWTVALDLFLGNPVLFMAHEDLFSTGVDAFNVTAATVNRLEPAARWASLGDIFRGLYRQRLVHGTTWEVEMLSDEIDLHNASVEARRYRVRRDDPHGPAVEAVEVQGAKAPWELRGTTAETSVDLLPGETRRVTVRRQTSDAPVPKITLRRRGLRNRVLRGVAEFRDLQMSGTTAGRWLTRFYYANKLHRVRWQQPGRLVKEWWKSLKGASKPRAEGIKS